MLLIVRWRGFTSFEGLGMLLLSLVMASDWLGLVIGALLTTGSPETAAMIADRVWPAVVHLVAIVAFAGGLLVVSPVPSPVRRRLTAQEILVVRDAGVALVVLGVGMKIIALWGQGIYSIRDYFANLYAYTVAAKRFGTFLDWGPGLAFLGAGLLAASYEGRRGRQMAWGLVALALAFFLTNSRAGIAGAVLVVFITVAALNPDTFRTWLRPGLLAGLVVILLVTAGVKSQVRSRSISAVVRLDVRSLANAAATTFASRFGDVGVYAGYTNMVNRQTGDPSRLMHGRVVAYTLIAWIPHIFYAAKPAHPFRDIGDLVKRDFASREDTVYAPTLVGWGFADFGPPSALLYLFFAGAFLGLVRRVLVASRTHVLVLVGYLHVVLVEGATNLIHNGLLNVGASVVLAAGAMGVVLAYVGARNLIRVTGTGAAPATRELATDV